MCKKLGLEYMKKYGAHVTSLKRNPHFLQPDADSFGMDIIKEAYKYSRLVSLWCVNLSIPCLDDILAHCPSLQELSFSVSQRAKGELTATKYKVFSSITDLRLFGNSKIVLDVILRCPNLRKLNLNNMTTHLTDSNLVTIATNCRHLHSLELLEVTCSEQTYITIATLCTDLVELNLYGSTVTDRAVERIAVNLKQLRRLDLQRCRNLTNAALHSIAEHCASTLESLWLYQSNGNNNITSDAVSTLRSKLPDLYVHEEHRQWVLF